jgi:Zinc finger, ZZ type
MCIFIAPVLRVTRTRILVAPLPANRQLIVYENNVEQMGRNAMVLPVPSGDPIALMDLSRYKGNVWEDCESMFPKPPRSPDFGGESHAWSYQSKAPLPVQRVGGYNCTIVPTMSDFNRLAENVFSLPSDIEEVLKDHYSSGFSFIVCAFQHEVKAHPIAYTSGRLPDGSLFIPTRHAHSAGAAAAAIVANGGERAIHEGVSCDVCKVTPLSGIRWKCHVCPDFDFCNDCYHSKRRLHNLNHPFLSITHPIQAPPRVSFLTFGTNVPSFGGNAATFGTNAAATAAGAGGDTFDHTLYLVDSVLVAPPSRYDDQIVVTPHPMSAKGLHQLGIPAVECICKVSISGDYPNRDYSAVQVQ